MDIYHVLSTRRSVRKFKEKPISKETIQKIMTAAGKAPSGRNRQNWKYIVVSDKGIQTELMALCANQKFVADCPMTVVICGRDISASYNRGQYMGKFSMLVDTSISFTHFMLAARAEGLGTCWIGLFDNAKIKQLLNVPHGWDIAAISPLGYPANDDAFQDNAKRMDYEELVSENRFTEPYQEAEV